MGSNLKSNLQVKEVILLLPALMAKSMRGQNLFFPSLDPAMAFGRNARSILPQLKSIRQALEQNAPTPGANRRVTSPPESPHSR